jgi:hypothetical protein
MGDVGLAGFAALTGVSLSGEFICPFDPRCVVSGMMLTEGSDERSNFN